MRRFILIASLLTLMHMGNPPVTSAQTETTTYPGVYVIQAADDQFTLYAVDPSGALVPTGAAFDWVTLRDSGTAEWQIDSRFNIAVSPNGTMLTFSAARTPEDTALFIYTFASATLTQMPLPNLVQPIWSPDSTGIILAPHVPWNTPDANQRPEGFVYDIRAQALTPLAPGTATVERGFRWLPDSETIVYIGSGQPCAAPCRAGYDIYRTDRAGTAPVPVTNMGTQTPADVFNAPGQPIWSEANQRLYFTAGDEETTTILYSTDLAGDIRLELSLADLYPNSRWPNRYNSTLFSRPDSAEVYLLAYIWEPDQTSTRVITSVLRLDNPDAVARVYEASLPYANQPFTSAISFQPDGRYVVMAEHRQFTPGSGQLNVIDLTTGSIIAQADGLDLMCDIGWLAPDVVLASQNIEEGCPTLGRHPFDALVRVDISSGAWTALETDLPGDLYLLLPPQDGQ